MAHFAKLGANGKVIQVLTMDNDKMLNADGVEDETVGQQWLEHHNNWPAQMWIQTSYNTSGNKHYSVNESGERVESADQSKAFRGNYAGIGYTYDSENDVFYAPKPYSKWVLNETTWTWEAPEDMPDDGKNYIWNDNKGEWEAKILKISKGLVEFEIIKQLRQKENMKDLWLAFSPIKSNYQNFMIQKATELGITKFLPIIFDRTIVRSINVERLKKIVIEASEQSNRINIPSIEQTQNLESFLNSNLINLIFTDLNSTNKKIDKSKLTSKPTCIIVGPEGDFSELEREKILTFKGVQTVKINENILRSETAVISAISIVNYAIN